MSGYTTFSPGEVIRADDVQGFLMNQSVMVFPSNSVRSTAIVVPLEGMLSWVEDDDKYQFYDGAAWVDLITDLTGGTAGQPYVSNGTAQASFRDMGAEYIRTVMTEKTASYTVQASDVNTIIKTSGTADITLTFDDVFPDNADMIQVVRDGAGSVVLAAGSGVTSWAGIGTANTAAQFYIDTPYAAAAVIKTATNEYRVIGRISV